MELVIPKSVTKIGRCAFQKCIALRRVSFQVGSRLEKIENTCFQGSALEEITIPKGVREIQRDAFKDC